MALVDHTEEGAGAPVLVVVPGRLDQVDYLQPNHVRPLQHPSLYAGDSHSAAVVTTAEGRPTKSVSSKICPPSHATIAATRRHTAALCAWRHRMQAWRSFSMKTSSSVHAALRTLAFVGRATACVRVLACRYGHACCARGRAAGQRWRVRV